MTMTVRQDHASSIPSSDANEPRRLLTLRVFSITYEADGIYSFDLRDPFGGTLPPFTAGAHIDVVLPNGIQRSYSLTNSQDERRRYAIGVARDANSRGGSAFMCETLRVGQLIQVAKPSNTFALFEQAPFSVLIAGGIGVTPILAMVERLEAIGRPWRLYFAARTRQTAAFVERFQILESRHAGRVSLTFDQEPGQPMLDLKAIVAQQSSDTHFYCCGPTGMLKAFEAAAATLDPDLVHSEFFAAAAPPARGGFEVVLAKSKKTVFIPAGMSILETLNEMGMHIAHSCKEGLCGTCETYVLEGVPDHRDAVLSKRERESNKKMMICCSGSLSERLVLDL